MSDDCFIYLSEDENGLHARLGRDVFAERDADGRVIALSSPHFQSRMLIGGWSGTLMHRGGRTARLADVVDALLAAPGSSVPVFADGSAVSGGAV